MRRRRGGRARLAIRRPAYATLEALLDAEISLEEDAGTLGLIARLAHVKRTAAFERAELLAMARWKSPRATPHYLRNRPARVRLVSRSALTSRSERARLAHLTSLSGVSVPVASAILTLIDPRRYGVLDIRVWQLLFALGAVSWKPGGRGFVARDWEHYLAVLRRQARRLRVPVRAVEYTLFRCHVRWQRGRLYDR